MVQETPKHILLKIFSSSVIVFCFSLWGLLRHHFFSLLLGFKALGFLLHTAQKQHNLFLISQLLKLHLLALPQWPKFSLPLPQKESLALQFNFFLSSIPQKMQFLESKPPPLSAQQLVFFIALLPISVSTSKGSLYLRPHEGRFPSRSCHHGVPTAILSSDSPRDPLLLTQRQKAADGLSDGDKDGEAQDVPECPLKTASRNRL